jgi:hypothetical protein
MKCQRCGQGDKDVSMHSGVYECGGCWTYRKLDEPAASHWAKVAAEFLSNVDVYDMTVYLQKCGLTKEEGYQMIGAAQKVLDYSQKLVKDGPEHVWEKS